MLGAPLVAGLVYVGLTISCPLSGIAFMRYSPKRVIVVSMILNALAVLLFGIAPNRVVLFIARIMIGFTQVRARTATCGRQSRS